MKLDTYEDAINEAKSVLKTTDVELRRLAPKESERVVEQIEQRFVEGKIIAGGGSIFRKRHFRSVIAKMPHGAG